MEPLIALVGAVFFLLFFGFVGGLQLARTVRSRRGERYLTTHGISAPAHVTAVEPMDRRLNHGLGHPVWIAVAGPHGEWSQRVTDGVGGYALREGTSVTVRCAPEDPAHFRIDEVNAPNGPYRVRPPRDPFSELGPFVVPACLLGGVLLAVCGALAAILTPELLFGLSALVPLVGVVLLVSAVTRMVRARRLRNRSAMAVGVITEQWKEYGARRRRRSRKGRSSYVLLITVYFALPDGREVHTRSSENPMLWQVEENQQVHVHYDTAHPPAFHVAELDYNRTVKTTVAVIAGVVFTLIGGFMSVLLITLGPVLAP